MRIVHLVSLNGLSQITGIPQHIVENWIHDFNCDFLQKKLNHRIYYELEAINVINFIKDCKKKRYGEMKIRTMLASRTFVFTEEEFYE